MFNWAKMFLVKRAVNLHSVAKLAGFQSYSYSIQQIGEMNQMLRES